MGGLRTNQKPSMSRDLASCFGFCLDVHNRSKLSWKTVQLPGPGRGATKSPS